MRVEAYLAFNGKTEEALAFYQQALGAKVEMMMRFGDSPDKSCVAPGTAEKIMHVSFLVGETRIMASDADCSGAPVFEGTSLSIAADSVEQAQQLFAALAESGEVLMPLEKTFWAEAFGMVKDSFGVSWMVNVEGEDAA